MSTLDEKLRHAIEREDWNGITDFIGENWVSLVQDARGTLRDALNALPDEVVQGNARWVAARDYVNFRPDAGAVRPLRFHHSPKGGPTGLLDVLAALTSRTASDRYLGSFTRSIEAVREAHRTLAEVPDDALDEIRPVLAEMRVQWAISLEFGGCLSDALHGFERTYDEALAFDNKRAATGSAGAIAFIQGLHGDRAEMERWFARIPAVPPGIESIPDTVSVMGHLAAALAAIDELDPEAAAAALERAPSDEVVPEQWAVRHYVEARLASKFGDPRAQLVRLRAARRSHIPALSQGGINEWLLICGEGLLLMAAGDLRGSILAVEPLRTSEAELAAETAAVVSAWALLRSGEPARAAALAGEHLVRTASPRTSAELLAVSAAACQELGESADAARSFASCLRVVLDQRLYTVLTRLQPDELDSLVEAAGMEIPAEVVLLLDRANRHTFPRRAAVQLSQRERVVLRHLIDGLSTDQIALREHVSRNTVKTQTRSLFRKLEVSNRAEAVRLAVAQPELWAAS